jgi:hypothetical protein
MPKKLDDTEPVDQPADRRTLREQIYAALVEDIPADQVTPDRRKYPDEAVALEKARGAERARRVAQLRAAGVVEGYTAARNQHGADVVQLDSVRVAQVLAIEGGVEVWCGDQLDGPPDFRIFNPPTLVEDPAGDIEVRGRRYREDPFGALVAVITGHRPAKKTGRAPAQGRRVR